MSCWTRFTAELTSYALASLVLGACAGAPAKPAIRAEAGASGPASEPYLEGPALRVRSRTLDFPLELSLPDKEHWQISDGPSWLVARHAASGSELALRTWRADRLVRREDCVADARLARPSLPAVREDALVERRPLAAPAGFNTELLVGVEPTARGISGYALAFGADVGRCYAAVFTTSVIGPSADRDVAARLALAVDRILSGVRVRSVDERAPRRHLVSTPKATPE